MTHEEIDKWVEDHAQFNGDWTDDKSAKIKQDILIWAKMIAHKFYEKGYVAGYEFHDRAKNKY